MTLITDIDVNTPIYRLSDEQIPNLYVKREDLIPYSFGGNKARKAVLFMEDYDRGDYDHVVTYGSSHSNHCRVIANICAGRNIPCLIISPSEVSERTYNSDMIGLFGASVITVPVSEVHDAIEQNMKMLREQGHKPYFIAGGGHGNIGTEAYVQCYDEICAYENEKGIHFDYIFFASGTGTTHAGLVCGQIIHDDVRHIIGISIARKNPRGRDVVLESITEYLDAKGHGYNREDIEEKTVFVDDYTGEGYGVDDDRIAVMIEETLIRHGIPLDATYTGKAFYGMKEYIRSNDLNDKNILFIHTGGTPLFFDELDKITTKER